MNNSMLKPTDAEMAEKKSAYDKMVAGHHAQRLIDNLGRNASAEQLADIAEQLLIEARKRAGRY